MAKSGNIDEAFNKLYEAAVIKQKAAKEYEKARHQILAQIHEQKYMKKARRSQPKQSNVKPKEVEDALNSQIQKLNLLTQNNPKRNQEKR